MLAALGRAVVHALVGTGFVAAVLLADATGDAIHDPGYDLAIVWVD